MLLFFLVGILGGFLALRGTGRFLDRKADKKIAEACLFHANGVLLGAEARTETSQKETAVIFIHGFTDSPHVFDEIIQQLPAQEADIFVPLLPFHGRALQEMKDFDPFVIEQYVGALIDLKAREYKKLVLVGQSMGGSVLIRLAQRRQWSSESVSLILLAPAVFLYSQNFLYQLGFAIYPHYRNYWRQAVPPTKSVAEQSLAYYVIPAVKKLHRYSKKTEKILRELAFPHKIFIAKKDNRVNARRLQQVCQKPHCRLVLFEQGSHLLYQGETISPVAQSIQEAIHPHASSNPPHTSPLNPGGAPLGI